MHRDRSSDAVRAAKDSPPLRGRPEKAGWGRRAPRTGCLARPSALSCPAGFSGRSRPPPGRAALGLHRGAPRRARARARGRAPHARARDHGVVEGGAHRRLPRLQPERARPHRRLAVLGARGARREGVLPAALGRGRRRRARGPAPGHRPRAPARGRRRAARRSTTSTTRSTPLLDLARRDEEEGLGDAPWPPHFAKQAGEPRARAAEPGARRRTRPAASAGTRCRRPAPARPRSARRGARRPCGTPPGRGRFPGASPSAWPRAKSSKMRSRLRSLTPGPLSATVSVHSRGLRAALTASPTGARRRGTSARWRAGSGTRAPARPRRRARWAAGRPRRARRPPRSAAPRVSSRPSITPAQVDGLRGRGAAADAREVEQAVDEPASRARRPRAGG